MDPIKTAMNSQYIPNNASNEPVGSPSRLLLLLSQTDQGLLSKDNNHSVLAPKQSKLEDFFPMVSTRHLLLRN